MNRLDPVRRAQVLAALVEGNSIRSTSRMLGIARNTINAYLLEAGAACARYQDATLRNLKCQRIQCDEIWSFCYAKDKNVPAGMQGQFGVGSVWTWTAIDADSKLIVTWMVGGRDGEAAKLFMNDVASRLSNRVQLTSDGHPSYFDAVERAFGSEVDYAMLIKQYTGD